MRHMHSDSFVRGAPESREEGLTPSIFFFALFPLFPPSEPGV